MSVLWLIFVVLAIGAGTWVLSRIFDGLRTAPMEPQQLTWAAPGIEVKHADLVGVNVRYVKAGSGPDLVLLHTLRTQFDIYQGMIPELQKHFTVYALDYPGHGWSDIPEAKYEPEDFYGWVERFLDVIEVHDATVAGTSIGGTIALELAARHNPRIARAVAINPYDYEITYGSGFKGSSFLAKVTHTAVEVPVIGETFMRLRLPWIERRLFEGGLVNNASLSDALFAEMTGVGNRPGHVEGFISLLRESQKWTQARKGYPRIEVPVLLVYSDRDWAPEADRQRSAGLIPRVQLKTVRNSGHFLPLDRPVELADLITEFTKSTPSAADAKN